MHLPSIAFTNLIHGDVQALISFTAAAAPRGLRLPVLAMRKEASNLALSFFTVCD